MAALGFTLVLTGWSAAIGLCVLHRLGQVPGHQHDALALAVPIGFGILALATLALGEFGLLSRAGLAVVLGTGAAVSFRTAANALRQCSLGSRSPNGRSPTDTGLSIGLGAVLAVTVLGTALTALAPVTDGDALCYHLQVPKVFLEHRSVLFDPDLHETVYPLVTELLYAVALTFQGPVACRLVQWVFGLVFAMNVTALARPSLGPRAWWAGTIAMLVPAVSNGMSAPLNDVALAAFGTAAIVAWTRYSESPTARSAIVVGLLAGLAIGVKYPALVLAGLLVMATATIAVRAQLRAIAIHNGTARASTPEPGHASPSLPLTGEKSERPIDNGEDRESERRLIHVAVIGALTLLIGGVWYLRAYAHTGNPVFPFFRHVFGGAGLDVVLDPIKRPMNVNPWNLLTALVPLTLQPDRFDSFSHQFGPIFLLFLPALFVERPPKRVVAIAALGYAFLALCLTQRQSMRFVLIAIGPMSVAVAWVSSRWLDRRTVATRVLIAALMLCLGFEASLAAVRARHGLNVVLGRESADDYLMRREPTYRVGRWIAKHLPADARIVGQDHRGYYIPRPYTMELAHRRRTGLGSAGESPERIVSRLQLAGFTHLLLCPPVPETAVEFDPALGRQLAPWLAHRSPIYQRDITDPDGVVRRYALYELNGPRLAARSVPERRR